IRNTCRPSVLRVVVPRGDSGAVGADGEGPHALARCHSALNLSGRYVPDEQFSIELAAADQTIAIRSEGQRPHNSGVRQRRARLAGSGVPEANGVIPTTRGDPLAVGAIGNRIDVAGVASEDGQGSIGCSLPEADRRVPLRVRLVIARRDEVSAIL